MNPLSEYIGNVKASLGIKKGKETFVFNETSHNRTRVFAFLNTKTGDVFYIAPGRGKDFCENHCGGLWSKVLVNRTVRPDNDTSIWPAGVDGKTLRHKQLPPWILICKNRTNISF